MPIRSARMSDTVITRFGSARQRVGGVVDERVMPFVDGRVRPFVDGKVLPFAVPVGRKAAAQARQVVNERILPAVDNARTASAPARMEAMRRGRLAAIALRGGENLVVVKRRRWPIALLFLALGGAVGAGAAWLAQAGKPVELTPYPLSSDDMHTRASDPRIDLDDEAHVHHACPALSPGRLPNPAAGPAAWLSRAARRPR